MLGFCFASLPQYMTTLFRHYGEMACIYMVGMQLLEEMLSQISSPDAVP